jgi:cobalt/nickel transport system permease protein
VIRRDVEAWSRRSSWLHARDARAKLLTTLLLLITIGISPTAAVPILLLLLLAALFAKLPLIPVIARAFAVLPFAATFAIVSWTIGDSARARLLMERSFLSALTVVILLGVTPVTALLHGLTTLGIPPFLTQVIHLILRYLSVLRDEARRMQQALSARGASVTAYSLRRTASTGAIATLFRHAQERSSRIHQSMLSRGSSGAFPQFEQPRWASADTALVALTAVVILGSQWAIRSSK